MNKQLHVLTFLLVSTFAYANDDNIKTLFEAISTNDLMKVKQVVPSALSPDIKDDLGLSALWVASAKGNLEIVQLLLDRGANIDALSYHGTTALWSASQQGQLAVVKELLNRGADPTIRDDSGHTAYFWASTNGHTDIAELLKNADGEEYDLSIKKISINKKQEIFAKPTITIEQAKKSLSEKNSDTTLAVEALFAYLNDSNPSNRRDAIWALQEGRVQSRRFVLALRDLLVDDDYGVQLAAARSLAYVKQYLKIILDDLVLLAQDKSIPSDIRQDITQGIGTIGPEAKSAVPALIQLLKEGRPMGLLSAAVNALGNIGPDAKEAVPVLIKTLSIEDNFYNVRASAAEALGKIGPNAKEAVPRLVSLIDNDDQNLRYEAIRALGEMRKSAKPAIPKLIKALDDPYKYAADGAAQSLGKIHVASEEVVDALITAMNDGREVTIYAMALGELGSNANKAVPALISIMNGRNHNIGAAGIGRYHAIVALGTIGGDEAVDSLISALATTNRNIHEAVKKSLLIATKSNKTELTASTPPPEDVVDIMITLTALGRSIGLAIIAATQIKTGPSGSVKYGDEYIYEIEERRKRIQSERDFLESLTFVHTIEESKGKAKDFLYNPSQTNSKELRSILKILSLELDHGTTSYLWKNKVPSDQKKATDPIIAILKNQIEMLGQ